MAGTVKLPPGAFVTNNSVTTCCQFNQLIPNHNLNISNLSLNLSNLNLNLILNLSLNLSNLCLNQLLLGEDTWPQLFRLDQLEGRLKVKVKDKYGVKVKYDDRSVPRHRIVTLRPRVTLNYQSTQAQVTRGVPQQSSINNKDDKHRVVFIHRIPVPTQIPWPAQPEQQQKQQQNQQPQQHHNDIVHAHLQQQQQRRQQHHDHISHQQLQLQQMEQWKEEQRALGVNSQYSRHQRQLVEDSYSAPDARIAPNVNPGDQEQEVEKPEVLEQEVLEQDDVQDDQIQKREAEEDLMEDNAIDPEQEESQKKSKNLFLAYLNIKKNFLSLTNFLLNFDPTTIEVFCN